MQKCPRVIFANAFAHMEGYKAYIASLIVGRGFEA